MKCINCYISLDGEDTNFLRYNCTGEKCAFRAEGSRDVRTSRRAPYTVWSVTCVTPVTLARTDALTYVDVYSAPQLTRFGA